MQFAYGVGLVKKNGEILIWRNAIFFTEIKSIIIVIINNNKLCGVSIYKKMM